MISFDETIAHGILIKRYKRFFMDIALPSGETVVAHTPNTGSMLGLLEPNSPVMLSLSTDPKRRTQYTAQAVKINGSWVGINTHIPNKLVSKSLRNPLLDYLFDYKSVRSEVPYGQEMRSRIDFLFSDNVKGHAPLYLEVKNVTLRIDNQAQFPDTISMRARKHIEDLLFVMAQGFRAQILFVVQRTDCDTFSLTTSNDKIYSDMLVAAVKQGLLVKALAATVNPREICFSKELPCVF